MSGPKKSPAGEGGAKSETGKSGEPTYRTRAGADQPLLSARVRILARRLVGRCEDRLELCEEVAAELQDVADELNAQGR